jgi:hypothetical protein
MATGSTVRAAFQALEELREALLEQRIDESGLVLEVVVDGRRLEAAARRHAPDRDLLEAALEQQRLGGVEDRPARALARARLFGDGGLDHALRTAVTPLQLTAL